DVAVEGSDFFPKAVAAEPRCVHPARVRSPRPVDAQHLYDRLGVRQPLWCDLGAVIFGLGGIGVNVPAGQNMMLVEMVIALENEIVGSSLIVEIVVNGCRVVWIRRETGVRRKERNQILAELRARLR